MKVRIKKTGEVVNIADYAKVTLDRCDSWGNPIELGFDEVEILQEPASDIDWEQRRYEIARDCVAVLMRTERVKDESVFSMSTISIRSSSAFFQEDYHRRKAHLPPQ